MTDTITLTREQWEVLQDGLDQIRDCHDGLYPIVAALTSLGLQQPADTIDAAMDSIVAETIRLQGILSEAKWQTPRAAKPRAMPMWLWPFNKSNREA